MNTIQLIQGRVNDIENTLDQLKANKNHPSKEKGIVVAEELLTQSLLELDSIRADDEEDVEGLEHLRKNRKLLVGRIQRILYSIDVLKFQDTGDSRTGGESPPLPPGEQTDGRNVPLHNADFGGASIVKPLQAKVGPSKNIWCFYVSMLGNYVYRTLPIDVINIINNYTSRRETELEFQVGNTLYNANFLNMKCTDSQGNEYILKSFPMLPSNHLRWRHKTDAEETWNEFSTWNSLLLSSAREGHAQLVILDERNDEYTIDLSTCEYLCNSLRRGGRIESFAHVESHPPPGIPAPNNSHPDGRGPGGGFGGQGHGGSGGTGFNHPPNSSGNSTNYSGNGSATGGGGSVPKRSHAQPPPSNSYSPTAARTTPGPAAQFGRNSGMSTPTASRSFANTTSNLRDSNPFDRTASPSGTPRGMQRGESPAARFSFTDSPRSSTYNRNPQVKVPGTSKPSTIPPQWSSNWYKNTSRGNAANEEMSPLPSQRSSFTPKANFQASPSFQTREIDIGTPSNSLLRNVFREDTHMSSGRPSRSFRN